MRLKYKVLASTALAATLLTGTALAANLSVTAPTTYSRAGVAGLAATAPVTLPTTNVVLQAQYAEQDLITVTVVGPALHSSTLPVMACTTPINFIVGFLGRTGNVITFRVTQVQSGTSTVGGTCTLAGLTALGTDIANQSSVTVNYSAQTGVGGLALDTACTGANCVANTATIATVRDQFNEERISETGGRQVPDWARDWYASNTSSGSVQAEVCSLYMEWMQLVQRTRGGMFFGSDPSYGGDVTGRAQRMPSYSFSDNARYIALSRLFGTGFVPIGCF